MLPKIECPNPAVIGHGSELTWFDTMPGERMAIRIHSKDVAGLFTILEAVVPPTSGPPIHLHKDHYEIFEVLEGCFRFWIAGENFDVAPGTSVFVPRGVEHGWANRGAIPARILFTFFPGGVEDLFPAIGRTPPEQWTVLSQRYDTWIVAPPIVVDDDDDVNDGVNRSDKSKAR